MVNLKSKELQTVLRVLSGLPRGLEVWAYGSRVHGQNLKPTSDLDLAVRGKLSFLELGRIQDAFSESDLPFKVDIVCWDDLPKELQLTIKNKHEVMRVKNE